MDNKSQYDKYFSEKDFSNGLAEFAFDIKKKKITRETLEYITEKLVEDGLLENTSRFDKVDAIKWDEEYLVTVISGCRGDELSKEYIMYYYDVATELKKRKNKKNLIISTLVIAGLIILACIYISQTIGF